MLWNSYYPWITVKDMYDYSKENNLHLLSDFNAEFWKEYTDNYIKYDKLFCRLYRSFRYFYQDVKQEQKLDEVTTDFTDEVYNHLLLNQKKYEELYRVRVLQDDTYNLTGNVNYTEDRMTTRDKTLNDTYGNREDSTTFNKGEETSNITEQVSPYDSENFSNNAKQNSVLGTRTDTQNETKGEQKDNHVESGTEDTTITRKGNIGNVTVTDLLEEFTGYWSTYQFYMFIFNEICKELLLA